MDLDAFSFSTRLFTRGFAGLESAIGEIADAGFRQVEIGGIDLPTAGSPGLEALLHFIAKVGVRARTGHPPAGRNVLGAPDTPWRIKAVRTLAGYFARARDLGAEAVVVHPVPNPILVPEGNSAALTQRIREAVLRSLDELTPVAEIAGVSLALETLPYACGFPMMSAVELVAEIAPYPAEHVGVCVDTGHAALAGHDVAAEILTAGRRLFAIHLSDNDGRKDRHWPPGDGIIDWPDVFRALRKTRYRGAWTFEVKYSAIRGEGPRELIDRVYEITWPLRGSG